MSKKSDDNYHYQHTAIGLYIKELRLNSNLTQQELGENVNIHRNSISRAENGNNITLQSLFQIAEYLEVSPAEILSIIDEF